MLRDKVELDNRDFVGITRIFCFEDIELNKKLIDKVKENDIFDVGYSINSGISYENYNYFEIENIINEVRNEIYPSWKISEEVTDGEEYKVEINNNRYIFLIKCAEKD